MVDVQLPIIGADFQANFSLLVDCRKNILLDGVTSLSTSAQAASTLFPSIKNIGIGTPTNSSPISQISRAHRESRGRCAFGPPVAPTEL